MNLIARQSTALELAIGPVLDADGVAVTGCVVGDFKLKKTTGNFAALNGSATLTHVSAGVYDLVLTTSDTDTVGQCCIAIDDTVNACASVYLQVIEEAVYDIFYAASATGAVPVASIANGAITAAAIATDAIDADALAADAGTELGTAVWATTTRALTILDEDTTTLDLDATIRSAVGLASANLDTQIGDLPTNAELATSQASADDATLAAIAALNNLSAAQVNTEVDTALTDIHLDHLLATTYDPASKPGAADALLNELVESDGGVARYTANSLEQAPTGGTAPTVAEIADGVWDEATAGHTTSGTFGEQLKTDVDAILVDTAEIGAAGAGLTAADDATLAAIAALNNLSSAQAQTAAAAALTAYDPPTRTEATSDKDEILTVVNEVPTNAELTTALGTADDAVLAQVALVKAKTDLIPSDPADASDIAAAFAALDIPTVVEIAEALLNTSLGAGTDDETRSVRNALRFLRNKWGIVGGTLTVTKENDTTTAWTAAVTQTAGDPVSAVDPA